MSPRFLFGIFKWLLGAANVESPIVRDVLIVEDVANDAELIGMICQKRGYRTKICNTLNDALIALKDRSWHRILLDMNLGRAVTRGGAVIMEGTIFIEECMKVRPHSQIVIVTGHAASCAGSQEFPLIVKGTDNAKFDNAVTAVLSDGGEYAQEMKKWKLFLFVCLLCLVSALVGMLFERFEFIKFLNGIKP